MKDIVLVGYSNAGKSFFAQHLFSVYGYKVSEIGSYVIKESLKMNITPYERTNSLFSAGQYLHFVQQAITERFQFPQYAYVFVGPRTIQEVKYLESKLSDPLLIAIIADYGMRRRRYETRPRRTNDIQLLERDTIERGWGLDNAIAYCPYRIENKCPCNLYELDRLIMENMD